MQSHNILVVFLFFLKQQANKANNL